MQQEFYQVALPFILLSTFLGVLATPFAIGEFMRRRSLLKSMELFKGVVIGHEKTEGGYFYTLLETESEELSSRVLKSSLACRPAQHAVGDAIEFYVDPGGSGKVILNEFHEKWMKALILSLFSVCGLLSYPVLFLLRGFLP